MVVRAASTYDASMVSEVNVDVTMNDAGSPDFPDKLSMSNSPNPFNPTTTIRFTVPAGPNRPYNLRVYDVAGRLVRELASGEIPAGIHQVPWDGRNTAGTSVGSGIYLYRLEVGQDRLTGKMVLVK